MTHHSWTTDFCTFCGEYFGGINAKIPCPNGVCAEPAGHSGNCPC